MALVVSKTVFRGMPAWRLSTDFLHLTIMEIGGHISALTQTTDEITPYWQPPWKSMNYYETDISVIEQTYGDAKEGRLLSCITGHNVCLDRFGAPWPGEDRPFHGEAGVSVWSLGSTTATSATFTVSLPLAGLDVARSFTFNKYEIQLNTALKPVDGKPRTIEWCEHVTIGDPFLDNVAITAGIDAAWNWPSAPEPGWRNPESGCLGAVPVDKALAMPPSSDPRPFGDVVTSRVVDPFFEATNAALKKSLRYTWSKDSFPWLCLWTEHRCRTTPPWNGVTRSRGLEFSTKPFPEGKPPAERESEFMGRPTTMAVPGEGRTESVTIGWTPLDV